MRGIDDGADGQAVLIAVPGAGLTVSLVTASFVEARAGAAVRVAPRQGSEEWPRLAVNHAHGSRHEEPRCPGERARIVLEAAWMITPRGTQGCRVDGIVAITGRR